MSVAHNTRRARTPSQLLLPLLLAFAGLVLFTATACVAANTDNDVTTAAAAAGEKTGSGDPYAYLDRLSLADLKKYAFDKYSDRITVDGYTDREALLKVVVRNEEREDAFARLQERVRAAVAADHKSGEEATSGKQRGRRQGQQQRTYQVTIEACAPSTMLEQVEKMLAAHTSHLGGELRNAAETISITASAYEPSATRRALSRALSAAGMSVMALFFAGRYFLPAAVMQAIMNKPGLAISTAMVLNAMSGQPLQTGALEVYVDGVCVFSKLETGVVPRDYVLSEIILNNTILRDKDGKL